MVIGQVEAVRFDAESYAFGGQKNVDTVARIEVERLAGLPRTNLGAEIAW